jgi:hypothetical protein
MGLRQPSQGGDNEARDIAILPDSSYGVRGLSLKQKVTCPKLNDRDALIPTPQYNF